MKQKFIFFLLQMVVANIYTTELTLDHVLDFGVTGNYQNFDGEIDFPYLYTFSTYAFEVYSISEENGELSEISKLPLSGEINSIQHFDNFIFAATVDQEYEMISTLYKIDITDPYQLQIVDSVNRNYEVWSLKNYNGFLAYHKVINGFVNGVVFLDQYSLNEINTIEISRFTHAVNDTIIAYVDSNPIDTVVLYNISDVTDIEYFCSVDLSASSLGLGSIYPLGNEKIVMTPNTGVSFWDISDLSNWQFLSDYSTVTPGSKFGGVNKIDDYLIIPQQNSGIEVVDISDYSNPDFVSFWEFPEFFYFNLYFSFSHVLSFNSNLYLGTFQDGIFHLGFDNGYIEYEDRILNDALRYTNSIYHNNHLITTSYNYGSQIYNVSDISNPFKVATILDSCYIIHQQAVSDKLIISYYDHDEFQYISLFDISNMTSPILLYDFAPNFESDFIINPTESDIVYIQYSYPNYVINKYDISIPDNPQLVASFDLPEAVGTGFFKDNVAYFQALTGSNDLYIYSNFENDQPILENCITNFGIDNYSHLSHIGQYLQLLNLSFNNRYYDLTDPINPSLQFVLDSRSYYWKMEIKDDILFSAKNCTLSLYDLSNNPSGQLQPFDSILLNSWYRDLSFVENANTNYAIVTQLECISIYEYEILTDIIDDEILSNNTSLSNSPNPFNPRTKITYTIEKPGKIELDIFNTKGQKVKSLIDSEQPVGSYEIYWNGKDLNNKCVASGVYFCTLKTDRNCVSKKMILLK
ncbi:MAG: T9SS type A sorting domain-containing protein [Candidatus Cloacimonetes bacterium]|nr:T9SS type A sorting domain-containing protein [Candidatus Cloacimonadota bacterium]MCF7813165.1 T9SS type A sorting domain-containing protein [Candidatus Cloacimonadota bacterium]MCF7859991.1 T9SS type A sorting domain-containing protein [Candidatus Cloacimonadota bacterium]MCF7867613.1 T9SS type A sorting domain-containing protein [Candidatus Cloacimonadota bacterium]MCF7883112.1 T9SS type A sorting domain-containing protein [Candidatus Cloacimonadota bacterium]